MIRFLLPALLFLVAGAATAQAPLFLPPDHWTADAIRRLSAAGLAPLNADPAEAPVTVGHARNVFATAAQRAREADRSALAELAEGYLERLLQESDTIGPLARLHVGAGWLRAYGEARGGEGFFQEEDWVGAQPVSSTGGAGGYAAAGGHLGDRLSWQATAGYLADDWKVAQASVGAALGPLDLWAGRRRLHYGAGRGGALVLGSGFNAPALLAHRTLATFDGVGLHVRDPFDFPGFLRFLGPARIEIVAGRLPENGWVEKPWVVFGRLTGTPFGERFMLGVNRGAIFGGVGQGLTLRRVAGMLVGVNNLGFENQIISAVMRYRPPLGHLPLELYLEFGADDMAGGWKDVPAYVAGIDLAAVPGLEQIALGIERSDYTRSCCGNPPWYRHVFSRGGWSDEDGRLFAHPLGGHGTEWLLHTRFDAPRHGLLARVDVFARERRLENLFSPERRGESRGVSAQAEYARGGWAIGLDGSYEKGDAWEMSRVALMLSHRFVRRR